MTMRMTMQRHDYPNIGETLYSAELPNGLRLRVVPKKGFATFYAAFAANYGGADRRFELDGEAIDTPAGVAHFLEHKMFDLPDGDSAMNLLSANGAEPNAFTSSDMTCYYFQCTKSFEENLRLLLHFVSTPYFTPETVQKEQGIIAQEILMGEDNPGMAIYYQLLRQLYARHPIRDRVAGTVESISGITDKTLYDCHRAFYAPSNMALCVEGDVDPERIYAIALEALPQERMPVPHADYGQAENLLPAECFASREMPVSAPQFLIGVKIAPAQRGSENLRQRLVAQLALRLLAGGSSPFYSRLYARGCSAATLTTRSISPPVPERSSSAERASSRSVCWRSSRPRPRGYPPRASSRSALNAPSGHPSAHACADSRISTMCASRSRARPLTGTTRSRLPQF